MDEKELIRHAFVKQGAIPNKVALASASEFGLKHAYFDVYKPADDTKKGVWIIEKDASGIEFIVRADDSK